MATMPTCSPLGPTSRTSGTRIRSLMRGSTLMRPPQTSRVGLQHALCLLVRKRTGPRHDDAWPSVSGRTAGEDPVPLVGARVGVVTPLARCPSYGEQAHR